MIERVISAGSFLRAALDWFEPHLRDCLGNCFQEGWNDMTDNLFDDYDYFEGKLTRMFGNPDEIQTAEQKIRTLRQTGLGA